MRCPPTPSCLSAPDVSARRACPLMCHYLRCLLISANCSTPTCMFNSLKMARWQQETALAWTLMYLFVRTLCPCWALIQFCWNITGVEKVNKISCSCCWRRIIEGGASVSRLVAHYRMRRSEWGLSSSSSSLPPLLFFGLIDQLGLVSPSFQRNNVIFFYFRFTHIEWFCLIRKPY